MADGKGGQMKRWTEEESYGGGSVFDFNFANSGLKLTSKKVVVVVKSIEINAYSGLKVDT
jgi:hypothetical protein